MEIEVDEDDGPPPVSPPPVVPPSPARREDRTGERRPSNSVDGSGVLGTRGKPQKVVEKPSAETTRLWYLLQEKKTKAFGDWLSHWEGQREVNIKDKAFGWTPIHFAAHKGASHFVKLLAEGKAQLDTACGEGNTALMCAARQNNVSTVSYLVGKKANLNAVNNNGWSALIWCAINGCEEVATALLSASANYLTADNEGRTACMWAARHGHLSMVETLLANGLNLLQVDDAGLTVYDHAQEQLEMRSLIAAVQRVNEELQLAVRNNDVDGVKAAIEEGADVNVQDEDGWTPLMWAALHQSLDMVQLVIRHGANPNLVDERGEVLQMLSTDHLAVGESVIEIVSCNERLLEHAKAGRWHEIDHELQIGAWVNVRDEARRTVLLWAARSGACEAVTNLVNKNADLDARDESGWLPVHWAAQSGSVETMCNLHYLGADFVSRTYVGETALHIAAQYNDGAMIQVLLASNADIEELNVDLRTALHMASVNGQTEALQTLLFYKADFEKVVEDESGMTAFLLAVTHERLSAVQCMLSDIPLPPRLPINAGTLSVAPKKAGKRTGSREPPELAVPGPKDPKAAGGTKAKAAPAPKTRIGNRKKLVKDVREKRGDHPRALLEHAAEIRTKLVKTPFGKIGRRLVNQCDLDERSALCLAVIGRHSNMVQILLSSKAELETTDSHGNGVLHYACMNRDREQVATFMDLNARVDRLNKDGLKPVDLCQEDPDILHMIERKLVSKKLETLPPSPTHVAPAVGINLEAEGLAMSWMRGVSEDTEAEEDDDVIPTEHHILQKVSNSREIRRTHEVLCSPIVLGDAFNRESLTKLPQLQTRILEMHFARALGELGFFRKDSAEGVLPELPRVLLDDLRVAFYTFAQRPDDQPTAVPVLPRARVIEGLLYVGIFHILADEVCGKDLSLEEFLELGRKCHLARLGKEQMDQIETLCGEHEHDVGGQTMLLVKDVSRMLEKLLGIEMDFAINDAVTHAWGKETFPHTHVTHMQFAGIVSWYVKRRERDWKLLQGVFDMLGCEKLTTELNPALLQDCRTRHSDETGEDTTPMEEMIWAADWIRRGEGGGQHLDTCSLLTVFLTNLQRGKGLLPPKCVMSEEGVRPDKAWRRHANRGLKNLASMSLIKDACSKRIIVDDDDAPKASTSQSTISQSPGWATWVVDHFERPESSCSAAVIVYGMMGIVVLSVGVIIAEPIISGSDKEAYSSEEFAIWLGFDIFFAVAFTLELLLRLLAHMAMSPKAPCIAGFMFFSDPMNVLDFIAVTEIYFDHVFHLPVLRTLLLERFARLGRIMKLCRLKSYGCPFVAPLTATLVVILGTYMLQSEAV